tara:strand:- start:1078 stop:1671 length:594 start_codon:yes stop_codon:yes gene_type:complete
MSFVTLKTHFFMKKFKLLNLLIIIILTPIFITSCKPNLKGGDRAMHDPKKRVEKNIQEGRGMRLFGGDDKKGGTFDFASSNELWRASLDTIDFMPLASANYSGGIIITDWYSDGNNQNESLKISIRFLTNEIRSDALDIKVFYKKCAQSINCKVTETSGNIVTELKKKILKKAAIYADEAKKNSKDKKYKAPKDWND